MPDAPPTFDLQSHSLHSDGELSPAEVVSAAHAAGVELLALTDHDSVAGVVEAQAQADRLGISLVSAVEISTIYEDVADLHVLGYRIDIENPALREKLAGSRADRESRAGRMVEALRELGYAVDEEALSARTSSGKTVGRPHIAHAVVGHPANRARLEHEGLLDPSAFLEAYLIEGKPAFRARQAPSVAEAIEMIHAAGGLAVWAHPFWDISADPQVLAAIDAFVDLGLDGVEVFYVTHTREQTKALAERCDQLGLLTTGSSDFHGPAHRLFGSFRAFSLYGRAPNLGAIAG